MKTADDYINESEIAKAERQKVINPIQYLNCKQKVKYNHDKHYGGRMSEIETMYENAGIKAKWKDKRVKNTKTYYTEKQAQYLRKTTKNRNIQLCYPPFTPQKQLELIKWLAKTRPIHISFLIDKWVLEDIVRYGKRYDTFNDALAGYVNQIWQDLTESEQEQIRSILNG